MEGLVESGFENLSFYSEVIQDPVIELIDKGIVDFASGCSLTLSKKSLNGFRENIENYRCGLKK